MWKLISKNKFHAWRKFVLLLLVFVSYFAFVYVKFADAKLALSVAWLTWAFFVLCTPIADAGFLIDFPVRLILKLKMWVSEVFVWLFAISLNLYFYFLHPEIYNSSHILQIAYQIYSNPYPYWLIIFLSAMGTFMSIYFADEILDSFFKRDELYKKHHIKLKLLFFVTLLVFVILLYEHLLSGLKISF